jgi:rhodanese-related sulfurtransferase
VRKKVIFVLFVSIIIALSSCFADNSKVKPELKKYLPSVELEKLVEKIKSGEEKNIAVVDVRPSAVYAKSHILTAINIPNGITNGAFEELKNKDLILYCETGIRVEMSKKNFIKDGFDIERMLNFGGFGGYKGKKEL